MALHQSLLIKTNKPTNINVATDHLANGFNLAPENPDLLLVKANGTSIGISQIQSLIAWAAKKPFQGDLKVALVMEAEKMTEPSQNALLKTLEEPNPETLIILTTRNEKQLLNTILSRVKIIQAEFALLEKPMQKLADDFIHSDYLRRSDMVAQSLSKLSREEVAAFISELTEQLLVSSANQNIKTLSLCKDATLATNQGVSTKLSLLNLAANI